jgi:predicted metalloendopeptidase
MRSLRGLWVFCALTSWGVWVGLAQAQAQANSPQSLSSGLDLGAFDRSVRPQDDLNAFVNGRWAAQTVIPADRSSIGTFDQLQETSTQQLRQIVDRLGRESAALTDPNDRAVVAFYRSYMDTARLQRLGLKPIVSLLESVERISSRAELAEAFGSLSGVGVSVPLEAQVHPHQKRSSEYVLDLSQGGLGLPDRDYYLSDDETFGKVRQAYAQHIERSLKLAGTAHPDEAARQILALETALARVQWSRVENRDPVKTYNETAIMDLPTVLPDFHWLGYIGALGAHTSTVNLSQPTYLSGLSGVLAAHPLSAWRLYLRWQVVRAYSPYLSKPFADEHFAFYGTILEGIPKQKERWKRGIELVDRQVGEALGRRYAETFFPPQSKARVETLVRNLIATYAADIETLDWMGADTKRSAHEKLDKLLLKIGYPDHWRDYSSVTIQADDLLGNVLRSTRFEHERMMAKLGHPVDRTEWDMTPPTINAYYNPTVNEIVFPAGILQPPFFDSKADDAVNYGAVGAVIGHEISHGFDDEGSQFDAQGNLRNWWTESDKEAFDLKAKALVAEYGAFEPVKGFHINGELTLGENIADNSGLAIAFKAYQRSLGGQAAPVIDGFTGAQRFYLGFAQVWREKSRDEVVIELIKTDPHSMPQYRVLGTVRNQPGYYEAFGVGPKDAAWLPPEQRVLMW